MTNYNDDDDDEDVATVIAPRSALPFGLQPEEPSKPLPAAGSPAFPRSAPQPLAPIGTPAPPPLAAVAAAPAPIAAPQAMTAPLPATRPEAPRAPGWVRAYLLVCTIFTVLGLAAMVAMKVLAWW
jgi:hypothetical protein